MKETKGERAFAICFGMVGVSFFACAATALVWLLFDPATAWYPLAAALPLCVFFLYLALMGAIAKLGWDALRGKGQS